MRPGGMIHEEEACPANDKSSSSQSPHHSGQAWWLLVLQGHRHGIPGASWLARLDRIDELRVQQETCLKI